MLKFISVQTAADAAARSAVRFPLALGSALYAAVVAQIHVDSWSPDSGFWRLVLPGILGISLFIAIRTTAERAHWPEAQLNAVRAATVGFLIALYLLSRGWSDDLLGVRTLHLLFMSHLLVAVLPFLRTGLHRASWQYNRILFQKFLIASLFTLVLFAGISIALVAIDNLFGADVDSEAYERLFYFLAFVFHPWFFLGNIPGDIAGLEDLDDYPAGLKIFGQYILIPVVTLYLAILTAYLVRVLVTHTWPSGWIGWLVSSVAAAGTLALLLVHPARERADSRWVNA
jgi:hypothetical protein